MARKGKTQQKTRITRAQIEAARDRASANEPIFWAVPSTTDYLGALNFYAENSDAKTLKGYTLTWVQSQGMMKGELEALKALPDWQFVHVGSVARLQANGSKLSDASIASFATKLKELVRKGETALAEKVAEKPVLVARKTVQENVAEKVGNLIADVEDALDAFWIAGKSDWNASHWLTNNEVKPALASQVGDYYRPLLAEAHEILAGQDADLREAYANVKRPVLKRYVTFLQEVIDACTGREKVAKAVRAPRKRKEKPAVDVVKGMNYLDHGLGITSVNPTRIVGAQQVWVFNIRYNSLGVYNAMGKNGLTVKGTSIRDFDPSASVTKRVKNPAEVLKRVVGDGKVALRKLMAEQRTKESPATGRVNKDTLIVRVL